jgi:pentatricopeptide repeat protein
MYEPNIVGREMNRVVEIEKHGYSKSRDPGKNVIRLAKLGRIQECVTSFRSLTSNEINQSLVVSTLKAILKCDESQIPHSTSKGDLANIVWEHAKSSIPPKILIYNWLILLHSKSLNDPNRGAKAEKWLIQAVSDQVKPDDFSYTSAVNAYVPHDMPNAERILEQYRKSVAVSQWRPAPFCTLMSGWSRISRQRVEELMNELLNAGIVPTVHGFMSVLTSQANKPCPRDAGERARKWCEIYKKVTRNELDDGMYTNLLHAWAMSTNPESGREADRIIQEIKEAGIALTKNHYHAWMNCWTKSGDPNSVIRAKEILDIMKRNANYTKVYPDALSYSGVIQAWAKSGLPEAPQMVEILWEEMQNPSLPYMPRITPTQTSYEALMDAHARSKNGVSRVFELLLALESMAMLGKSQLKHRTYAVALLAISNQSLRNSTELAENIMERMERFGVRPNIYCYSLLITIYAKDRENDQGHLKALHVFNQLKQSSIAPNLHIYSAVITACANHGDLETAKSVFNEAREKGMISIHVINAVLNALRKAGTEKAAEEAETMLLQARQCHQLDKASFSTVINAWGRLGNVDRAMALFCEMKTKYPHLINAYAYSSVMLAYLNSSDVSNAAEQVEKLLQEMKDKGYGRNPVVFDIVKKVYSKNLDYRGKLDSLVKELEENPSSA